MTGKQNRRVVLMLLLLVGGVYAFASPGQPGAEMADQDARLPTEGGVNDEPGVSTALPKSSPDVAELAKQVIAAQEQMRCLSAQLQEIALDEDKSNEDRRAAIVTLGKLGDEQSCDFLARHIGLTIPMMDIVGDKDMIKEWPCYYALSFHAGWKAIPPIFEHLQHYEKVNRGKPDWPLTFSANVLKIRLGVEAAEAMLEAELRRATEDLHRENLQEVLRRIR